VTEFANNVLVTRHKIKWAVILHTASVLQLGWSTIKHIDKYEKYPL